MVHAFDDGPGSEGENPDFDPDYDWAGGSNPLNLWDGDKYESAPHTEALEALSRSFYGYCDANGALATPTSTNLDYFTSSFYNALNPGTGKNLPINHLIRANREENYCFVLLFSHLSDGRDNEFYLPTAVARPLTERAVSEGVAASGNVYGLVTMEGLERIEPPNSKSGIGYLVKFKLVGDETVVPQVFGAGSMSRMALSRVEDVAESVRALKAQQRVDVVRDLEASSVLALALAQVAEKQSLLLGVTGIELEASAGIMHLGVKVPDFDSQIAVADVKPAGVNLNSTSGLSPMSISERELGFRFKITEPFADVIYPALIDDKGKRFTSLN
jgi:hypothetical protein